MSWNPIADVPLKQMYFLAVFENIINKNIKPKGWCDEFETGLNIIIAIVQKV